MDDLRIISAHLRHLWQKLTCLLIQAADAGHLARGVDRADCGRDILRDRYSFPHASVVASVDGASLFIAVVNQADAMEGPRFSHDGFTGASTCVR